MEKEYRSFTFDRLFSGDRELTEIYCKYHSSLFYNPLAQENVRYILSQGALWVVKDDDTAVAITCTLPADSFFMQSGAGWNLADMLGEKAYHCMVCGYLWVDKKYSHFDFYTSVVRLWATQGKAKDKSVLIHLIPAHWQADFEKLFYNGFELMALRGLDNLVPYWVFVRNTEYKTDKTQVYHDVKNCPSSDTKTLSMLCEKGYRAFDMDVEKNLIFRR